MGVKNYRNETFLSKDNRSGAGHNKESRNQHGKNNSLKLMVCQGLTKTERQLNSIGVKLH